MAEEAATVSAQTSAWELLKMTVMEWNADNAAHLSAALAYYTIFSIAPLLIIAVGLAGVLIGRDAAQSEIAEQVELFLNDPNAAALVQSMAENANQPTTGLVTTIVGLIALFYGATNVFGELRAALNFIWDVPPKPPPGLWQMILSRLLMLVMVMAAGFLLLASLIASIVLTNATAWVNQNLPGLGSYSQLVNFSFLFVVTLLIFVLVYKYVPDVRVGWSDVWIGAVATALLFSIGRWLLSLYLSQSIIASVFGAAGSLVVILLWIYYSAQIFLLGAEFTQVYGRTYGTRQREHLLLEEPELTNLPPTEERPDGTIVPATVTLARPPRFHRFRRFGRSVIRPAGHLALAVSVITLVALYNILREPFRR